MAKSKIIKANEKIADYVVNGYQNIENSVVDGYKRMEDGVVQTFEKISDQFVDHYLTKDGETVEDAKKRLEKEKEEKHQKV